EGAARRGRAQGERREHARQAACARCQVPDVDPDRGERGGHHPRLPAWDRSDRDIPRAVGPRVESPRGQLRGGRRDNHENRVCREGTARAPALADDAAEKTAVAKAKLPAEPSKSFDALKAKLLEDANRGLIAEGAQVEGKVQIVKFTPSATPVMTLTVIYYKT